MSGPVTAKDVPPVGEVATPAPPEIEITPSRSTEVGGLPVRRALPRRTRRTVGAWCFVDHMGPVELGDGPGIAVGPHPHMGLQTVTWLLAGEVLHTDSLGSEQLIRPGQLNLMTAGHGVAHAEIGVRAPGREVHGVQLWLAQPSSTREGAAAFEHHGTLPTVELGRGAVATVVVGELGGVASPARRDTDHVGIDLDLRPSGTRENFVALRPDYEYAIVVLQGSVATGGSVIEPGHLAYLGEGRDELALSTTEPSRALLIGGRPFEEPVLMWWNFVARAQDEITDAQRSWARGDERFGVVPSSLDRIEVAAPPWAT